MTTLAQPDYCMSEGPAFPPEGPVIPLKNGVIPAKAGIHESS